MHVSKQSRLRPIIFVVFVVLHGGCLTTDGYTREENAATEKDPKRLQRLVESDDYYTLYGLGKNPLTPRDTLLSLVNASGEQYPEIDRVHRKWIRHYAAKNPNLTEADIRKLRWEHRYDSDVLDGLMENPNFPQELLASTQRKSERAADWAHDVRQRQMVEEARERELERQRKAEAAAIRRGETPDMSNWKSGTSKKGDYWDGSKKRPGKGQAMPAREYWEDDD